MADGPGCPRPPPPHHPWHGDVRPAGSCVRRRPMATTVADQLIEVLLQAGVRRIYGLVGDSLNPIVDAVRRSGGSAQGGIDWIHVHNEEAGALAASAEAQLTGRLAVCAGSCGPGNTHLVNGLYDAHRSGAPVLAIASHIPSSQIGTTYFQETPPTALFAECSSWVELISAAAQMPRLQRIAMQTALADGGVSVLVLPGDVSAGAAAHPTGARDRVEALAEHVDRAGTVTLFVGAGARDARTEVLELAEKVKAPVGHSLGGKG